MHNASIFPLTKAPIIASSMNSVLLVLQAMIVVGMRLSRHTVKGKCNLLCNSGSASNMQFGNSVYSS